MPTVASYYEPVKRVYGSSIESQWFLRSDGAYTRPCGCAESSFYWDAVHNGTSDAFEKITIDVRPDVPAQVVFSQQNVSRAWMHLKRLYPLLGAQVEEHDGDIRFVVFERNLHTIRPDELVFIQASSEEQASNLLSEIVNEKRKLPLQHSIRAFILTRTDVPQRAHIVYQIAHIVSDGMSQATLKTTLLDLISKERPFIHRLEDRLALAMPSDALWFKYPKNSPRQRWKLAIAAVLKQLRPLYGGHTLPQKMTTATPYSTVISREITVWLPHDLSARIIIGCKKIGITFGNVFPLLAQIAVTRILFRQYMRGEISEEEWEFRKREPMHTAGPANIRPLMDNQWYQDGGKGHICNSVGFFTLTLPHIPLGELANAKPSAKIEDPPFSSFMSKRRFLLRCEMAREQFRRYMAHPLFFETNQIFTDGRLKSSRIAATRWKKEQEKPEELRDKGHVVSPMELSRNGPVWTHTGSSFGNVDDLYPARFPLDIGPREAPIMRVKEYLLQLHCRPAQLYLGSSCGGGRISIFIDWDANVYDDDTVKEWMEELRGAAEWYLASDGQKSGTARL